MPCGPPWRAGDDPAEPGAVINWPALDALHFTPQPYPHTVIDQLFEPEWAAAIAASFPTVDHRWHRRHHLHSDKHTFDRYGEMPSTIRKAIAALHGPRFMDLLAQVADVERLEPDWDLFGGGMHVTQPGGFLDVHADFQVHPTTGARRVLNLLAFFNPGWQASWGGYLELWTPDMQECAVSIAPLHNRAVLFATSATSFHGQPVPLTCPPGVVRKSLALYWYTPAPETAGLLRTTDYRPRPHEWKKRWRKRVGAVLRDLGVRR